MAFAFFATMKRALIRVATNKWVVIASALILIYALAGFFLAPYLVERYVPRYATEQLGHPVSLGKVRINPFLLDVEANDFRLQQPDGNPLVAFRRLFVNFKLASIFHRAWTFGDVQLEGLDLYVEVRPDGALNFTALTDRFKTDEAAEPSEEPRRVLVQRFSLREGTVTVADRSIATPASAALSPINLEVADLATMPDRNGRYAISAALPQGGVMTWRGEVSLQPIASSGDLEIKGLALATAWAFIQDTLQLGEPAGSLDAQARYRFAYDNGKTTLAVEGLQARVFSLALKARDGDQPLVNVEAITTAGGRLDLASREITIPTADVRNGRIVATRDANGRIPLVEALTPKGAPARNTATDSSGDKAQPWKYNLEALKVQNVDVALSDSGYQPPVAYDVNVASASLQQVTNDGKTPIRFDAALRVAQGGGIEASGTIAQDFASAEGQAKVSEVALTPLQPLVARYAAVELKSGTASASTRFAYQAKGKAPLLRAMGAIEVGNLLVNEAGRDDRLLSWKTLSADEATVTLAPLQVAVKEVRVVEPGAKIVISKQRELNLLQVLKNAKAPDSSQQASAGAKAKTTKDGAASNDFSANIARITMRNGAVEFSDSSLVLPFATRVRRFNGAVVGLSTERGSRAELKFQGRIEGSGSASAEGGLNPFGPKAFTDVRVKFDNVQMPPLSPYSATFAGYKIASGRLWLDLQYKIANSQLAGENKVTLDDFTLGERVESPNAMNLPLELAVAILKDSQGKIDVAVPVTGDLNNPQFNYGAVIRAAIAGVITRVVSAPFRAMGKLFGGGAETLGNIDFAPGNARLAPPEREKLDKVAATLKERGQLKLVVQGPYNPKQDAEALRNERVRREIVQALGVKLDRREDPGPLAYSEAATQRALEAQLTARSGPNAVQEFTTEFEKNAGRKADRVNRLLAVFGRGSEDREYYQAMFDRLVERYPLPEEDIQALAKRRAETIVDYLVKSTGTDPSRIESGEPRAVNDPSAKSVTGELGLAILKSSS